MATVVHCQGGNCLELFVLDRVVDNSWGTFGGVCVCGELEMREKQPSLVLAHKHISFDYLTVAESYCTEKNSNDNQ